jgi:sugar lactone lactonase YvrE
LFKPVKDALQSKIAANETQMVDAQIVLRLQDAGLLPEDLEYDPTTKRFFVTSVLKAAIFVLDASGNVTAFAAAPDHWPMLALKIDRRRHRMWATEVALDGFASVLAGDWGRSAILEFDLDKGTLLQRVEGPKASNLGDMTLAANGEPIMSDGQGGGVYRLHDGQLTRIDHGDFISPQTPALCGGGHIAFIPDYVRGLAALDLRNGDVRWLLTEGRFAVDGIDGLYCRSHTLFAVRNGGNLQRVVAFALNGKHSAVVGERVIERRADGDFTHGVFVGARFYYLADVGWSGLDEHGAVIPNALAVTPKLMSARGSLNPHTNRG